MIGKMLNRSFLMGIVGSILGGLSTSSVSYASFNLMGGASQGFNSGLSGETPSLLAGAEVTINLINVIEAGVFYDRNFLSDSYLDFAGAVGRVGLGPLMGLFIDAKVGFSPKTGLAGFGGGMGYHFNSIVGIHGGVRVLNEAGGTQTLGDLSLMLFI